MCKGGGQTTTTTTEQQPFAPAEPFLKDILGEAQNVFRNPPDFFPFSTTAPLNPFTTAGFQSIANRAQQGSDIQQGGGNVLRGVLGGGFQDPSQALFGDVFNRAGQNPALDYLNQTASGAFVGQNPFLDATFDQAAGRVTDAFNDLTIPGLQGGFNEAGRTGSGAFAGALGREVQSTSDVLNNLATNIYGGAYGQERALQEQARAGLGSQFLQGLNPALAAAGGVSGAFGGDVDRMLQTAFGAPGFAATDFQDADKLREIGQGLQGFNQQSLQAEIDRFNFGQNQPFTNLQRYASLVAPISGLGGVTSTSQPQQDTTFSDLLGGALGVAGLFSSAEALKEDIGEPPEVLEDVKEMEVKSWKYRGDDETRIGPMAEDFNARFYDKDTGTIDIATAFGVTFKAIQELSAKVDTLAERVSHGAT